MQRARTFAFLLRRHRGAAGLTQEELAGQAGLGVRTISNLERGISKAPYRSTIRRLADALELPGEDRIELAASAHHPVENSPRGERTVIEGGFLGALPTAPLVARDEELGRILDALEAAEGGSGRLVLLAGEPGIGKTRLAQAASVRAWEGRFLVATGRCYEAQSGVPYYPFLEALCTLYEEAPPKVRELVPERWPYLTRLLPDHFRPQTATTSENQEESQRLLRAVTGFVREVCAERPVALLLDDLHCADGASVDLLAHLSRHTRGERVLLVGTYRDVEVGPDHALRKAVRDLDREQLVEKIGVRRLGPEATAALMSERLEGAEVSEEFASLVYHHTEGNPFFTVEVLKDLIERGDLFRWDGSWVRKEIEDLRAPESVSEAISDRVSRLQPQTQNVLEGASVLGQVFGFEELMAVVGLGEEGVEETLEEAEASGLLRAARERYGFDHALTQQTLYAGLSPMRRKRLHRSAGEGLEGLGEKVRQKRAAEISRHFVESSSPERALPYALLAGDEAEAVFAHGDAKLHYRRALELADDMGDGPASSQALEKLGGVLASSIRYDEALDALERAADAYRDGDDPEGAGRAETRIAQTHFRRGTSKEGIARLSAHLASADRPGRPEGVRRSLGGAYGALAQLFYAHGQYAGCRDAAQRGARLSRAVGDTRLLAETEKMRGIGLLWTDAPDEGVTALKEAVRLAEGSGAFDTLGTALLPLYLAHVVRGDLELGRECCERGIAIAKKMDDAGLLAMHTTNLGIRHYYEGDWREARICLERAVGLARSTELSYFSCLPPAYLGVLCKAQGAWKDASRRFSDAADLAREAGSPEVLGYAEARLLEMDVLLGRPARAIARLGPEPDVSDMTWWYDVLLLSILAEAYVKTGDVARAEEVSERALTRAELMNNRVDGVEALRIRAKSLSMQTRREEATAALDEALSWARSMPYPYAEGRILREHGMLYVREREPERARERLSAALEIFRRLGAKKDAEQTWQTLQAPGRTFD